MPASSSRLRGEQRLAVLRVARQRLQAARLPVDPGGVLLLGRRHRVDRLHHLLPAGAAVVGAQRGAHLPGERVVGEIDLATALAEDAAGAQELVRGLGLQLDRGLARDAGPGVRRQVGRAGRAPSGRSAAPRPVRCRSRRDAAAPPSPARRRCGSRCRPSSRGSAPGCRRSRPSPRRRRRRSGRRPGARRAAGWPRCWRAPSSRCRPARAASPRRASRRGRRSRRRHPSARARRRCAASRDVLARQLVVGEREAGDLAVVVHAKARVLGGEGRAVAALHQLEQPVVAQPVLDVGAAPALREGGELGRLDLVDAVRQLPVVDPHRERVALGRGLRLEGGEADAVVAAEGVARVDDGRLEALRDGRRAAARTATTTSGERERREGAREPAGDAARRGRLIYWIRSDLLSVTRVLVPS